MKIASIVAARPNFVKLASIHHALKDRDGVEHIIIHTGQHSDPLFSDVFFEQLDIADPDHNLGIISKGNNEETVALTRDACVPVLQDEKPDVVLVYGDVSGALGGAQAASDCQIPVGHIEAGLRSFDKEMPEENNRIAIDRIAQLLFVTEESGMENLEKEGREMKEGREGSVHFVGNTMIDTLVRMMPMVESQELSISLPERFGVVTMHRPSNVDTEEDLRRNIDFLNTVSESCPLVFPIHKRTRASVDRFGLHDQFASNVRVVEPLGYLSFLKLVSDAAFVLTDSGGIQEETVFLKKKCFTLRLNTERPGTIEAGSNELIDLSNPDDQKRVLDFASLSQNVEVTIPEKWDGKAGERIVEILSKEV